jgi:peptidyl-prolyl cis-trans isomerase C
MLPCLRLLRVVSLVCVALTVCGIAQAQQPAAQPAKPPAAQAPAQKPPQAAPQPKDPVVATVNGQPIYLSELEIAQQALPEQYRNVPLQSVFPALIERIINAKLVVADAKKNKADADAAYKKRMAFVEEQVVQDYWLTKEVSKRITPEKMQERYQEKLKSMPAEEEVHARHILVATEQEAKDVLAELKKGTAFDKLAREKSTDKASGAEGGDLGWFKRTDMVKEFADAAFNLKKGELSDAPVKTQFGFHVIKVEDRRQAPPPSFDELSEQIRDELGRETVAQFFDQLRSTAKIEKFNIDGSKVEAKPAAPPPAAPAAPSGAPAPALPNPPK